MNTNIYKKNQKLTYIGRGFLGFDKECLDVFFISKDGQFDSWVKYKGVKLLVGNHEIK